MRGWIGWAALIGLLGCSGDGNDDKGIIPDGDADTDADADSDTDTDADTDADTDTDPPVGSCGALPHADGAVLGAGGSLRTAIDGAKDGDVIEISPGTYAITDPLVIDKALTIVSTTSVASDVVLDMGYAAGNLFEVRASDFTLAHVTITRSGADLVNVKPVDGPITGLRIHDVRLHDPGAVAVTLDGRSTGGVWHGVDQGEISCSDFLLTETGRDNLAAICDTGMVLADGIRDFAIRDNRAEGFWCIGGGLEVPTIRVRSGSRSVEITRNQVLDTRYGIQVGDPPSLVIRGYDDIDCGTKDPVQAYDVMVTNNIVASHDEVLTTGTIRAGILLSDACESSAIHNSVYSRIEPLACIEYGVGQSSGEVSNNLVSHSLVRVGTNEAVGRYSNVEDAPNDTWFYPFVLDFHTSPGALVALNQGDPKHSVDVDIDGEPRSLTAPDIGADER